MIPGATGDAPSSAFGDNGGGTGIIRGDSSVGVRPGGEPGALKGAVEEGVGGDKEGDKEEGAIAIPEDSGDRSGDERSGDGGCSSAAMTATGKGAEVAAAPWGAAAGAAFPSSPSAPASSAAASSAASSVPVATPPGDWNPWLERRAVDRDRGGGAVPTVGSGAAIAVGGATPIDRGVLIGRRSRRSGVTSPLEVGAKGNSASSASGFQILRAATTRPTPTPPARATKPTAFSRFGKDIEGSNGEPESG